MVESPIDGLDRTRPPPCRDPFPAHPSCGVAGNLTTDAHLAALAIEHQARIVSTDNDFARFPGLRWFNPLSGRRKP